MAKFTGYQETYRYAEQYEFDRRIAGTMNTIAAQLHAILRFGKGVGVRTANGIMLERADDTTKYVVRAGNDPLWDPLEIDMRGGGATARRATRTGRSTGAPPRRRPSPANGGRAS